MPKKKIVKKHREEIKFKMDKKTSAITQGIAGILAGLLLSAIIALIVFLTADIIKSYFAAFLLTLTLFFVYPIGVFIGVYVSGIYLKSKGIVWSTLTGLFASVIIFIISLFYIESSPIIFWIFTILIYPILITLGYYRFGFKIN